MSENPERRRHLLVFPFPAQGHLIPLLDHAHHLSTRGFSITVIVTPKNLPLLHPFLSTSPSIHPLLLPFPSHTSISVEHVRDLPPSASISLLIRALSSLRPQIFQWAQSHPNPPSALLSDFFLGWTHHLAADLSIPRIAFFSSGALLVSVLDNLFLHMPRRRSDGAAGGGLVSLPSLPAFPYDHLPSFFRRYSAAAGSPEWEFAKESMIANSASWAAVINTFDALESPYLTLLRQNYGHPRVWAVGPIPPTIPATGRGGRSSVSAEEISAWLDPCPARSVVYVCFGSQFSMAPPQAAALAAALERSGSRFVWCVGGADSAAVAPEGFEERVRGRGLVIKGWAPQVAVLSHAAVGSFLTHCGWNSVLEGIAAGVVLLAWPMEADQFVNAKLLVEEARVAVLACSGGPNSVPDPNELGRVLGESVDEGTWPEVRARAAEMGRNAAEAVGEGGSSYRDMEKLVKELSEL